MNPAAVQATEPIHRKARRRGAHIYASLALSLLIILVWALARISVCWGRYSWLGGIACHSQWATFVGLMAGTVVLVLLVRDLSEPHLQRLQGRRFRRTRAVWRGYRELDRLASRHVTASTILLILGLLAFAWLVFFSPVRF
jgi:hypothetical protein